jgi:membrane-bound lytic murein transglycosylase A
MIPPDSSGSAPARPRPTAPSPSPVQPSAPAPAPTTAPGENAVSAGIAQGPDLDSVLPADNVRAAIALRAFRISCPSLMRRRDQSGLTQGSDWQSACGAAASWSESNAREFFRRYFEAVQVGSGAAFVTGYYEPEIAGCRARRPGCDVPVYRKPTDLIEVDLGLFSDSLKGKRIRGKTQAQSFVPYDDRAAITGGSLGGRGLELAYAADPIELFFLEVQGSGRLRDSDGSIIRIGYDGQNGRDYTGIGKLMKDRGLIQAGSMQDIMQYLRAHPAEGVGIMNENKSYIFFKELTGAGPLGALGLPVTAEGSVAADPAYVPLGVPVLLSVDRPEVSGLWVAQDTGGAIKGANRFDSFWGAGEKARTVAGGLSTRGTALLLLPLGTYARLSAQNGPASPQP